MAYRKLNLDWDKVAGCRNAAAKVVKAVQKYVDRHSSLSIESASLCVLGVEHFPERKPIANLVITKIDINRMRRGACYWFGCALLCTGLRPDDLGYKIATGHISMADVPEAPFEKVRDVLFKYAAAGIKRIDEACRKREEYASRFELMRRPPPLLLAVAEKSHDAKWMTAGEMPDIILTSDYQRILPSIEGLKNQSQSQKKFAVKIGGLESPKEALESILFGVDIISYDVFEDVLKLNINPKRAFVDAHWVKKLCARSKTTLYSECAQIRPLDAYRDAHQVVVCQLLAEEMAEQAGLAPELIAVGHGFDVNPLMEDAFIHELARAALMRELYARNQTFYLAPKSRPEKDIDTLRNLDLFYAAAMITEQSVVSHNHAAHLPDVLKSAALAAQNMRTLGDEIQFNPNGKIARRARTIIENALKSLVKLEHTGLWEALLKGQLGAKTEIEKEAGLDGIFQKERNYYNPVEEMLSTGTEETYCLSEEDKIIKKQETPQKGKEHRPHRRHFYKERGYKRFKNRPSHKKNPAA
jgi:beta-lysine 5,6-aminomutase alpha subunit